MPQTPQLKNITSRINMLPKDVIAKIAAGEVVDRPASVVKELFENSLDAGSTSIEIHLKDAGKELIHVRDNGCGMAREDLEKIFQRHATSKIKSIDDLERLASMGFRGEALYAIGAVSDVVVRSKPKDAAIVPPNNQAIDPQPFLRGGLKHPQKTSPESGWEIHVRAGVRQNLQPAAMSSFGTDIQVAELFFNTPARRKFLKNNASEMAHIVNVVLPYALIYPHLRILLTHGGKDLLDLRPWDNRLQRVAQALNVEAKDLLTVSQDYALDNTDLRLQLTLGTINVQRPRRDLQFIFVNNRPVDSKNISFNLNDVFKLILPPGIYGCFIVEIHLNPACVDVNIHPTKREVRLHQEARLISLTRRLAEQCLMTQGQVKIVGPQSLVVRAEANSLFPISQDSELLQKPHQVPYTPGEAKPSGDVSLPEALFEMDAHLFKPDNSLRTRLNHARFLGQWMCKFLLFEEGSSLFIVDQHAAQERIMFEKFQNQINAGDVEIQSLLTPVLVKLSPVEKIAYEDIHAALTALGIETTSFDSDTIAIHTQPVLLKNIVNAVRVLLAGDDMARCDSLTLARRACKASIVTGDALSPVQADHQRKELLSCQDPFTCPHGRPTVIELTEGFIDREFLRT